jgi:hypothetical protein
MGSQGGQQGQRMLPGLFESLHNWKAPKKGACKWRYVYFTARHSPVGMDVDSGNVKRLTNLLEKAVLASSL